MLMAWCFSTRASVATELTTHPCISRCLGVNMSILLSVLIITLFVFIANSFFVYGIKRSRQAVHTSTPSSNTALRKKNDNAIIVLLISSTCAIFNLPDVVYVVLSSYYESPNSYVFSSHLTLRHSLSIVDSINRSINILFFCIFGKEFRMHMKELIFHPCKIGDMPSISSSPSWILYTEAEGRWPLICGSHFQMYFLDLKCSNFPYKFTEMYS